MIDDFDETRDAAPMAEKDNNIEFVQSLARGLSVLQSFGPDRPSMTLTDVAKYLGLARGTSRRLLHTLDQLGFVRTDGKLFWLTPKVMELGYLYLASVPWWRIAQPILEEAAEKAGQSCNAAVLEGTDIIYMAGVSVNRYVATPLGVGSRLPAFTTASGRMLLSQLPEAQMLALLETVDLKRITPKTVIDRQELVNIIRRARSKGYCLIDGELEPGLRAIAVPVLDRLSRPVAALAMTSHSHTMKAQDAIANQLPVLMESAAKITKALPL